MPNSWGFSSAGRAPALHAGGQEFESPNLHHLKRPNKIGLFLLLSLIYSIKNFEKKYREFDILVGR